LGEGDIRVGVIGLGAFGRHHARHFAAAGGARLVALSDADPARATAAADEFGGETHAAPETMIGAVDAVAIAAPAIHHAAIARPFIAAGVHVLVEKPLATNPADARALVTAAEDAGVVLQVGHIERFSPAVRELHRRVTDPRRITTVRRSAWSPRSGDVDVVLDMMIHDIDHVLALTGAPPVSVAASGQAVRGALCDEAEAWLTFADGAVATLSASRVAERTERRLTVTEPTRMFLAELATPTLTITGRRGTPVAEALTFPPHDNLGAEIAAFLAAVRGGPRGEADGRAGLAAVEVAARIQAAIADADVPIRRSL
jgi:predicted dehydrogenase